MKWEIDQMRARLEAVGEDDVPKKRKGATLPLAAELLKALGRNKESKLGDGPVSSYDDDMDRGGDNVDFR